MEYWPSITNPSMISSVTLFVQVPFVSTLLQFTGYYIIAGSNTTTIIHQAMSLNGLPLNFLYSELVLVPGCRQSLGFTLLVTGNRVCRLLSQDEVFLLPLDVVTPWLPGLPSIFWGRSLPYFATAGRIWSPQVSGSGRDDARAPWFDLP